MAQGEGCRSDDVYRDAAKLKVSPEDHKKLENNDQPYAITQMLVLELLLSQSEGMSSGDSSPKARSVVVCSGAKADVGATVVVMVAVVSSEAPKSVVNVENIVK
jgi:hypothetical protein